MSNMFVPCRSSGCGESARRQCPEDEGGRGTGGRCAASSVYLLQQRASRGLQLDLLIAQCVPLTRLSAGEGGERMFI